MQKNGLLTMVAALAEVLSGCNANATMAGKNAASTSSSTAASTSADAMARTSTPQPSDTPAPYPHPNPGPALPGPRYPVAAPVPLPPQPPANSVVPPNCQTASGATQAVLTSPTIANDDQGIVQVKISLVGCDGSPKVINAAKLLFDFDGDSTDGDDLPVSITDNAGFNYTGRLNHVVGSDLFGHSGGNWSHYESDNTLSLVTTQASLMVSVTLGSAGDLSPGDHSAGLPNGGFTLPLFLQLGDAALATVSVDVSGK